MQMHEFRVNTAKSGSSSASKYNSNTKQSNQTTNSTNNLSDNQSKRNKSRTSNRDRQTDNDAKSASVMSNSSSYSLIDDDHIDDQETINVGNLIIDLESDLEKEKIENEQAGNNNNNNNENNATPCSTNTTTSAPSSTTSSYGSNNKAGSSSNVNLNIESTRFVGKSNQKLVGKHSNNSTNNPTIAKASNNGHTTTRTVFKSSADERGELKMKITRETQSSKNQHKITSSPNHKSPASISNNNSKLNFVKNFDDSLTGDSAARPAQSSSSISSTKECGTSTSVGTITEPDCLGPCEPGTSVTLEGIVWQETDGGILVVNVTWRGKTYVGALLDCTRHDWAPPRLCDSPASDIDSKTNKGVRAKRIVTRSNGIGLDEKNLLQTTGKLRNGKGRRLPNANDPASCNKKQRESSDKSSTEILSTQPEPTASVVGVPAITSSENVGIQLNVETNATNQQDPIESSNISIDKAGPNSPMLIGCNEPNCSKKYRNMNGLLYHQAHAHSGDNESNSAQDELSPAKTKTSKNESESYEKETPEENHPSSPSQDEVKEEPVAVKQPQGQKRERSLSPQISSKLGSKMMKEHSNPAPNDMPLHQETARSTVVKSLEVERRHSTSSTSINSGSRANEFDRRSPGTVQQKAVHEHYGSSQQPSFSLGNHHSVASLSSPAKPGPSNSKQSNQPPQPPLPATTEEGIKPSGTSTGPPPAPHQANCYFNSAFLANSFGPYGLPPYFPRHMYDQIAPPTSNAFLTRFMNNMRVPPPPDSPSRLLSPSMPKTLPFPPFKVEPGVIPSPVPTSLASHPLPNMPPLTNPPLSSGSPHLRMPSQADPMLPPTSQPPFLPPVPGLHPGLGLPGAPNPLGPLGGPQVPSLVDDSLAKQFPRRFN